MPNRVVDLTNQSGRSLLAALHAALGGSGGGEGAAERLLPSASRLHESAHAAVQGDEGAEAAYFQAILEIAYLVASADGFAAEERQALAELIEQLTGKAVDQATLELHFRDLDEACEQLGRRERLRRAAAEIEDGVNRAEAMGFAVLVGVADGRLAEPELRALGELGSVLGLADREVEVIVDRVIDAVKAELGRA
jgi:tellurite resistance protein